MRDPIISAKKPMARDRLLRVALAVSVALNLLVVGLGVGAMWHGSSGRDQMTRDLGFGPFSEALGPNERRALRKSLLEKSPEIRMAMQQRRADLNGLLLALRAQPFDADTLNQALEAMRGRMESQLTLGHQSLSQLLISMSDKDRQKFADRLEQGQRRGGKDRANKPAP
jgi:uncharacterized membrane protein